MRQYEDEVFDALFVEAYLPVARYVRRHVPDATVQDIVADTFVVAWRRMPDLPQPPLPWLLGVARGLIANERRGTARRTRLLQLAARQRQPIVPDVANGVADRDSVRRALASLSANDQELLGLIGWDGLDVSEAAQVLGIRTGTAAVRLHRARERLQAGLAATSSQLEPDILPTDATASTTKGTR